MAKVELIKFPGWETYQYPECPYKGKTLWVEAPNFRINGVETPVVICNKQCCVTRQTNDTCPYEANHG